MNLIELLSLIEDSYKVAEVKMAESLLKVADDCETTSLEIRSIFFRSEEERAQLSRNDHLVNNYDLNNPNVITTQITDQVRESRNQNVEPKKGIFSSFLWLC